jgi:hypothetical protein
MCVAWLGRLFCRKVPRLKRPVLLALPAMCVIYVLALPPSKPAETTKRPGFVDVAPRSRIIYKSNNSLTGRKYFPQPMCGGIAVFDYDNDGKLDIFLTNGAKFPEMRKVDRSFYNCLLHQEADGTFKDVTESAGLTGAELDYNFGVAVGDYDNDGYEDLFIASAGRNVLYHNNGNGTFTDVTAESGIGAKPDKTLSVAAAWFDYDNDGLLGSGCVQLHLLDPGAGHPLLSWEAETTTAIHDAIPAFRTGSTTT